MNSLKLSWRMLLRDARSGELRVLAAALVIAVASVTSVGFFADRIGRALELESHQLIGADLVVSSDRPLPSTFVEEAKRRGLTTTVATNFPSMASTAEGRAHLAGLKAVGAGYPLRGSLRTAPDRNQPEAKTREIPAPGSVWLDEQLATSLEVRPGALIGVGDVRLKFDRVLTLEPDRGASFFSIAPRLMMNEADLARTKLIQTGSRVTYRLLVAGDERAMREFNAWITPKLERGQRLEDVSNARPEARATITRAKQFLGLVALLAVVLAAVSVALASRRFTERHLDGCAVLRTMGSSQASLLTMYATEFLMLGLGASLLGCLIGYAVHALLAGLLGYLVATNLPAPGVMPALQGFATGTLLLLGFALPPLVQLTGVPPVRVIRRETGDPKPMTLVAYGLGVAVLVGLMLWQAQDLKLGLITAAGFAAALAISALITYGLLRVLAGLRGGQGFSWRYGIAAMRRRSLATVIQVVSLSLGLAALLMLTITRGDLLSQWQKTVPPDAPNRFIINVQPEQRDLMTQFFVNEGLSKPSYAPMIRGRLVAVNGKPTGPEMFSDDRARRLVDREFNLSYGDALPRASAVVQGVWHGAAPAPGVSMEEGIMKTLKLKLGDSLTYDIAGRQVQIPITSVRKVDWDSMQVNFFAIASTATLKDEPQTYISAVHLPEGKPGFTDRLVGRLPNLTVVDVSAIIGQVKGVINQVVQAVQFIFFFTLAAGVTVLYAALSATQDERTREAAIMRALGASSAQLKRAQWAEFLLTGALAGLFAAMMASAIGAAVGSYALELPGSINPWVWVAGVGAGAVCAFFGGALALGATLRRSPMQTLRAL